jgi:glyoxylate utilization-related uncharacterized protein
MGRRHRCAAVLVTNDADVEPDYMPGTGAWGSRFVDPADMRHDSSHNRDVPARRRDPFETHVMEHGLYVLEGKAVYNLNNDWVEVEAGDFMHYARSVRRRVTQVVRSFRYLCTKIVTPAFKQATAIRLW